MALAMQAAIAVENARLFEHSEARAHELAILNEVGQTITSTLDLTSVLDLIMSKVVELLDVEAGSLLMLDEAGENLVFQVALGPAKDRIKHSRLPLSGALSTTPAPTHAGTRFLTKTRISRLRAFWLCLFL